MEHNWLLYIAGFACAFGISLVTTPFAKKLSYKVGAIAYPKKRGMHAEPIPQLGGIAIVLGFIITLAILSPFVHELRTTQFLGFVVGAVIIVVTGVFDDIHNLRPRVKLAFQIIAALVAIFSGNIISFVMWPFPTYFSALSIPITLIWIVGITNAINFIDGLDGLAAGVSSICAMCLLALCVMSHNPLAAALAAVLAGSCLGFLPRNFNPAEVIMGDCGALFLGYVLAVSSIIGVFKSYAILSVFIAAFAIALPIFDTFFAMLRRALSGKHIMTADRGHLHHRLVDAGYSHKHTVFILYGLSILSAVIAVLIALNDLQALLVVFVFLGIMSLMLYVYKKRTDESNKS